jgi:hypothetical protein
VQGCKEDGSIDYDETIDHEVSISRAVERVRAMMSKLENLRTVKLDAHVDVYPHSFHCSLDSLPSLTSLTFLAPAVMPVDDEDEWDRDAAELTEDALVSVTRCEKLRKIRVVDVHSVTIRRLLILLARRAQAKLAVPLESLDLEWREFRPTMAGEAFVELLMQLPALTSLRLVIPRAIDPDLDWDIHNGLEQPMLHQEEETITGNMYTRLGELQHLRHLHIDDAYHMLSPDMLQQWSSGFPALRTLRLEQCIPDGMVESTLAAVTAESTAESAFCSFLQLPKLHTLQVDRQNLETTTATRMRSIVSEANERGRHPTLELQWTDTNGAKLKRFKISDTE